VRISTAFEPIMGAMLFNAQLIALGESAQD